MIYFFYKKNLPLCKFYKENNFDVDEIFSLILNGWITYDKNLLFLKKDKKYIYLYLYEMHGVSFLEKLSIGTRIKIIFNFF